MSRAIPWWLKIAAKIVLSRLPFDYEFWNRLKLFRHGNVDDVWAPAKKFLLHFDSAFPQQRPHNFVCLELGPGDSVAAGIIAQAMGAKRTYLVDVGAYAEQDVAYYRGFCDELNRRGIAAPNLSNTHSFEALLETCAIEYLTDGVKSLAAIPRDSVDFIWSHSVLEHVRRHEFGGMVGELRRIIRDGGRMSHNADLKDHLGGALNNLRFSEGVWESEFMVRSGFYTNRLQYGDIRCHLVHGGFEVIVDEVGRWPALPTPLTRIHPVFRGVPEAELRIRSVHMTLRPAPTS